VLRQAVSAFRGTDISREEELRWLWLACRAALIMWDYDSFDVLSDRQVTLARDAGALIMLPIALTCARQRTRTPGSSPRPPRWWRRPSR
jgi:hypothetical protein